MPHPLVAAASKASPLNISSAGAGGTRVLLALCAALFVSACSQTNELTEQERGMLLTESSFALFAQENAERQPQGRYGKLKNYMELSTDYSYEFKDPQGRFYIMSTVADKTTKAGALVAETTLKAGILIGLRTAGATDKPLKLSRQYGSKASLALVMIDNRPAGNIFSAVIDDKALLIMFTGIYFDDPEEFHRLILEQADAVQRFES